MGQTLSSPEVLRGGRHARFQYAVTEKQVWRISMEDAHAIVLELQSIAREAAPPYCRQTGHSTAGFGAVRRPGRTVTIPSR
ncbi:hypothetical protein B0H14DRAFT_3859159 [Mycena olivaceomarginata]|nr:hypothetical protein B0H14DRAFT_3859159 [Mycena olivaceomarginata]